LTTSRARVGAVVLARDRPAQTRRTIEALIAQQPAADYLLLVDNDGTSEVSALLAETAAAHARCEVLRLDTNRGCAGGFEAGLARLLERDDIELICGFDDDATPRPGCVEALREAVLALPDAGEVGAVAHDSDGTLAWPMYVDGQREPLRSVEDVRAAARQRGELPVANLAWQGLMFRAEVLRKHGNVWGDLFLQYEDIELGLRFRQAGLRCYLVPGAECMHPAPPSTRQLRIFGRAIDVTHQSPAKEYLTLRNGLIVWHRYDGLRFWYGTGPFVLLRGLLSALTLDLPRVAAFRHVFLRGVFDAIRGHLGPPPKRTSELAPRGGSAQRQGTPC
jgi:GT2 family glycosyltransferase